MSSRDFEASTGDLRPVSQGAPPPSSGGRRSEWPAAPEASPPGAAGFSADEIEIRLGLRSSCRRPSPAPCRRRTRSRAILAWSPRPAQSAPRRDRRATRRGRARSRRRISPSRPRNHRRRSATCGATSTPPSGSPPLPPRMSQSAPPPRSGESSPPPPRVRESAPPPPRPASVPPPSELPVTPRSPDRARVRRGQPRRPNSDTPPRSSGRVVQPAPWPTALRAPREERVRPEEIEHTPAVPQRRAALHAGRASMPPHGRRPHRAERWTRRRPRSPRRGSRAPRSSRAWTSTRRS